MWILSKYRVAILPLAVPAPYANLIGDVPVPEPASVVTAYTSLIGDSPRPVGPKALRRPAASSARWYTLTTEPGVEGYGVLNDRGEVIVERRRYAPGFGPATETQLFPSQHVPYNH